MVASVSIVILKWQYRSALLNRCISLLVLKLLQYTYSPSSCYSGDEFVNDIISETSNKLYACMSKSVCSVHACVCVLVGGWVVAHVHMRNVGSEYSTAYSFLA